MAASLPGHRAETTAAQNARTADAELRVRIALVTETYPPEINGVALTVQSLLHGLVAAGHAVELVRPRPAAPAAPEAGVDELHTPGAALPRYPGLKFGLPVRRRLLRRWRATRPDAVYVATEGPLGASALRAARALHIPTASGFHTRFDDFARHYGFGFLTPIVFAWLRRFHRRADATLVPTEELAAFLRKERFGNVRLLRRAVDTQQFSPQRRDAALRASWGLQADDLAVVYVGRIAPEKNLDLAVRAFRAIQAQQPRARYVWVGDGPAQADLAAANPDFIFLGTRRGTHLASCYASADLFLFPSLTETFGNVTLEAMASGVATVAYDYGAAREHLVDGVSGRRVARDDADGFVAAALELARDPALRRACAAAARAETERLHPDAVVAAFVEILCSLTPENAHEHARPFASA